MSDNDAKKKRVRSALKTIEVNGLGGDFLTFLPDDKWEELRKLMVDHPKELRSMMKFLEKTSLMKLKAEERKEVSDLWKVKWVIDQ